MQQRSQCCNERGKEKDHNRSWLNRDWDHSNMLVGRMALLQRMMDGEGLKGDREWGVIEERESQSVAESERRPGGNWKQLSGERNDPQSL